MDQVHGLLVRGTLLEGQWWYRTISTAIACRSFFYAVSMCRSAYGNTLVHSIVLRAIVAVLSCQWNLSTGPFAAEWYGDV